MIGIVIMLVVVGCILHLIRTYIPMDPPVKTVLTVVVVLALCLWLLQVFGFDLPVPRIR
jgi:hypothetical protein